MKRIYNKRQRLAIYKLALVIIQNEIDTDNCFGTGFCYALDRAAGQFCSKPSVKAPQVDFKAWESLKDSLYPELVPYRPNERRAFWFPTDEDGVTKRRDILSEIIESM